MTMWRGEIFPAWRGAGAECGQMTVELAVVLSVAFVGGTDALEALLVFSGCAAVARGFSNAVRARAARPASWETPGGNT